MEDPFEIYRRYFMKYFPRLRRSQEDLLLKYMQAQENAKIIEIEAPPGTGKSLVNMIIAFSEDSDFNDTDNKIVITVKTKNLQHQYVTSFAKVLLDNKISYAVAKGLSSFGCKLLKKRTDICIASFGYRCPLMPKIEEGPFNEMSKLLITYPDAIPFGLWLPYAQYNRTIKVAYGNTDCNYWENQLKVFSSKVIFTNHSYLLTHLFLMEYLPFPSVLIIDEAHTLYDTVSDNLTFTIDQNTLKLLSQHKILSKITDFVKHDRDYNGYRSIIEYLYDVQEELNKIKESIKGGDRLRLANLLSMIKAHHLIISLAEEPLEKYFELVVKNNYLQATPSFYVTNLLLSYISNFIKNRIIMSSATLPPIKKSVGNTRISSYLDVYRPAQRLVIYLKDSPKISNNTITSKPVTDYLLSIINYLYSMKRFRRIVIHSVNNFIRDVLASILESKGYNVIVTENLEKDFQKWLNTKEGIIISSALSEGVDLKYDIARVQILVKMPIPDTRKDAHTRWMKSNDIEIYNYYIAQKMVQIAGRICRAHDDVGVTIVLDRRGITHLKKYKDLYPKYYLTAARIADITSLFSALKIVHNMIEIIEHTKAKYNRKELSREEVNALIGREANILEHMIRTVVSLAS